MSLRHLAPRGDISLSAPEPFVATEDRGDHTVLPSHDVTARDDAARCDDSPTDHAAVPGSDVTSRDDAGRCSDSPTVNVNDNDVRTENPGLRRSTRDKKVPAYLSDYHF